VRPPELCVPHLVVQCRVSQFFSDLVHKCLVEAHLARCVPASDGPCILRARLRPVRAPLEWVRGFHLRDRFVPAAVPARLRADPDNAMFRVE
jgi:hypothetical protein